MNPFFFMELILIPAMAFTLGLFLGVYSAGSIGLDTAIALLIALSLFSLVFGVLAYILKD